MSRRICSGFACAAEACQLALGGGRIGEVVADVEAGSILTKLNVVIVALLEFEPTLENSPVKL